MMLQNLVIKDRKSMTVVMVRDDASCCLGALGLLALDHDRGIKLSEAPDDD